MQFAFIIEDVKAKAKTRWYYNRFPKPVVAGFTLAEILLTLTIIAVVASLAIPALLNSVAQSQYNTGVWQADNMLSQAVEQLQANNGIVNVTSDSGLRNDLCNVMQCVRTDTTANLYFPVSNPFYYLTYKGSAYTGWNVATDGRAGAILSNGMYLCDIWTIGSCAGNAAINACGYIGVDINGPNQGPNMLGEDLYYFWVVLNNGVYTILPCGTANDTYSGPLTGRSCQVGNLAQGCTYQRLYTEF